MESQAPGASTSDASDALAGDLLRILGAVVLFGVAALWVNHYAHLARTMYVDLQMNDFGKFYYSGVRFLAGEDMYGPTPATSIPVEPGAEKQFWNLNPPHFHLLILPLALLTPGWALALWAVMNAVALALSIRVVSRELAIRWTYWRAIWLLFGVIVCSATGAIVFTGQFAFLLLLPVTLAWAAARRGSWARAAAWVGLAASVKPFIALLGLMFVLRRHVRAAAIMIGVAAAAFAAGLLVFGVAAHAAWLAKLAAVDWAWASMNGSVAGLLSRTFSDNPLYASFASAPWLVTVGGVISVIGIGGVTARLVGRGEAPLDVDRAFAAALLASQLISPLGWVYYLWLLLGPGWALLRAWERDSSVPRRTLLALAVPGLVCPISLVLFWRQDSWLTPLLGSIYTWTTLFLWGAVVMPYARSDESTDGFPGLRA